MPRFRLNIAIAIAVLCFISAPRLDARLPDFGMPQTRFQQLISEADPTNELACFTMGTLNISYRSEDIATPNIGLRVTDPWGRAIGYDLRTDKGWQQLPLGQAFFTCDGDDETGATRNCQGHIEICGPVSGAYQVEILPTQSSTYAISIAATTQNLQGDQGSSQAITRAEAEGTIQNGQPEFLTLHYSRESARQITLTPATEHLTHLAKAH